jgi:hypothetical protein
MKNMVIIFLMQLATFIVVHAQDTTLNDKQRRSITELINQYSLAREKNDTGLLKEILTANVDQLVSNGEWRQGIRPAIEGMLRSSASTPGKRTLSVYKIQLLNATSAIVDCRYEIQNEDGTTRKMWSTFIIVTESKKWKIRAIRNMLPAANG